MKSRVRNMAVGALVLVAGIIGLFLPVSVWDGGTSTVGCGNALVANQSEPQVANDAAPAGVPFLDQTVPRPDFVAECDSAISGRRHWAIPLVVVGAAGVLLGVMARGRRRAGRPGNP